MTFTEAYAALTTLAPVESGGFNLELSAWSDELGERVKWTAWLPALHAFFSADTAAGVVAEVRDYVTDGAKVSV